MTSRVLGPASSGELEAASKRVTQLSKDPGNEAKLKLYALYKQVSLYSSLFFYCVLFLSVSVDFDS